MRMTSPNLSDRVAHHRPVVGAGLVAALTAAGCNEINLDGVDHVDAYEQSPWEKVDVLLVVDNSGSMGPYQNKLGDDFGGFFDFFAEGEVDWQLAVTHTDAFAEDFGRIRGPIVTPAGGDPASLFAEVVNLGIEGNGLELGLEGAVQVLEAGRNGFPRDDASVSVIFVSDEEDASPRPVAHYLNRFFDLRGARNRQAFNASALTVTEIADCEPEQFALSAPGTRYVEAAVQTGGITANLCVDDFERIVVDLALTTSAQLNSFPLRARPDLNTLDVYVDRVLQDCTLGDYQYDLLTEDGVQEPIITFPADNLPGPGAGVVFEYRRGNGDPASFCPGGAP